MTPHLQHAVPIIHIYRKEKSAQTLGLRAIKFAWELEILRFCSNFLILLLLYIF